MIYHPVLEPKIDPRKEKRYWRKGDQGVGSIYDAYTRGEAEAYKPKPRRNPFPPGFRHDAWNAGFSLADPLGLWHGSNL